MSEKADLQAFLQFYKKSTSRLQKSAKTFNRTLKKDPNPIVRTFKEDLADLNEGGKMLRGVLVGLGYRLAGGAADDENENPSDPLALAFEIFQTGILRLTGRRMWRGQRPSAWATWVYITPI